MPISVTKGRGQISELTHLVPIRRGSVPQNELGHWEQGPAPSFANRLRIILKAFNDREDAGFPSVIRLFRGIHVSKWALIDGDTRLLLSVMYDGDFTDYMRALARDVPAMLHLVWSNTVGWEPFERSASGMPDLDVMGRNTERLMRFIRAHQVEVSFLYAHHPDLIVRDIEYLKQFKRAVDGQPGQAAADALQSAISRELESFKVRQRALLERYTAVELNEAKRRFTGVVGALFDAPSFQAAFRETFGRCGEQGP
jgi:hypothetical protein